MNRYDLIVVGAGAAGLLCAGFAAQRGLCVAVVEKNAGPGKKLLITGKGRCNVTNDCDVDTFIRAVRHNGRFLYSAIHAFGTQDTIHFFEECGVPLKVERGARVFPCSDRAGDILEALLGFAKSGGVSFYFNSSCEQIKKEENLFALELSGKRTIYSSAVVIATGGMSYPTTGSTGDGYRFAQAFGHTIVQPRPSLVPIISSDSFCRDLMGLSLRNVTLKLQDRKRGKVIFEELGEMLFTHFGVSGPLVLSASSHMEEPLANYQIFVDLKPGLDLQKLDHRLLRDFEKFQNKDFRNALGELLPRKLIPVIIKCSGIDPSLKVNQITREMRQAFCMLVKNFPISVKAFRPIEEAIVTSGGVTVSEVNPKTMQSKLQPGVYFAGEVLDLDAYTGGFNLQIAFSTAYLAAKAVLEA